MSQVKRYPPWPEIITFSADGPHHEKLIETDDYKAVLVGLEATQKIPPHPAAAAAYHFLEGQGWMVVDGERLVVEPGITVAVPAALSRGVEAETRLVFLASHGVPAVKNQTPPPLKKMGLFVFLSLILMYGLMMAATFLLNRSSPLGMMFSGGMDLGSGMWALMILPLAGMLIMLVMMAIFFRLTRVNGSSMTMTNHAGMMAQMMAGKPGPGLKQNKDGTRKRIYNIPSVNCGHCKMTIEQNVGELAGIISVTVDVQQKQALIEYSPPANNLEIEGLLARIGYPPSGNNLTNP